MTTPSSCRVGGIKCQDPQGPEPGQTDKKQVRRQRETVYTLPDPPGRVILLLPEQHGVLAGFARSETRVEDRGAAGTGQVHQVTGGWEGQMLTLTIP